MLSPTHVERRKRCESTCRLSQGGFVDRMISHAGTRTAYCVVPKASCTFWLSVFRFLHNDTGNATFRSPLDIPRGEVHAFDHFRTRFKGIKPGEHRPEGLDGYLRFIFVRNPYSRLWSSYIDKHFLLDFWSTEGPKIAKFFRSGAGSKGPFGGSKWNSKCSSGHISFAEFLAYVADNGQRAPQKLNEHWRPVEYLCNPCAFCPQVIGRMDTFKADSAPVLRQMNLTWILDGRESSGQTLHQMLTLIKDNFRYLGGEWFHDKKSYTSCMNATVLAPRLWSAFQLSVLMKMKNSSQRKRKQSTGLKHSLDKLNSGP
nr:hypothetical protein BaRGS_009024 [Batillaria attramentaria]